jgi:hypothetical protein
MVGCNIHNAESILTQHQNIKTGDKLIMHPKAPAISVTVVDPEKALVYGGRQDENTANVWIFFINEEDGFATIVKLYEPRW